MTRRPSPVARLFFRILVGFVRAYQFVLRPILGPNCRFSPSCSDYAIQAIAGHGAWRGTGLAASRILRCNPWHRGGYDPVPQCGCVPDLASSFPDRDRLPR